MISPYAETQACGRFTSSIIDGCRMEEKKPSMSDLAAELHDGTPSIAVPYGNVLRSDLCPRRCEGGSPVPHHHVNQKWTECGTVDRRPDEICYHVEQHAGRPAPRRNPSLTASIKKRIGTLIDKMLPSRVRGRQEHACITTLTPHRNAAERSRMVIRPDVIHPIAGEGEKLDNKIVRK
jgi:hypothetical protein